MFPAVADAVAAVTSPTAAAAAVVPCWRGCRRRSLPAQPPPQLFPAGAATDAWVACAHVRCLCGCAGRRRGGGPCWMGKGVEESNVPPEEQGAGRWCCIYIVLGALAVAVVAMIVLLCIFAPMKPQYYATIDAISGLDKPANLSEPAPEQQVDFHLTLGVKSGSPFYSECLEPGASVVVTYLSVEVASGSTGGQACAEGWQPEKMVQMPVVLGGTAAPGSVLDGLAADVRRGVAFFDLTVRIPATSSDDAKLVVCKGRRLGGFIEASIHCKSS